MRIHQKSCDGHCWISAGQLKLRTTDGEQAVSCGMEGEGGGGSVSSAHCSDLFVQEEGGRKRDLGEVGK